MIRPNKFLKILSKKFMISNLIQLKNLQNLGYKCMDRRINLQENNMKYSWLSIWMIMLKKLMSDYSYLSYIDHYNLFKFSFNIVLIIKIIVIISS
jgi:hypothetical protein